MQTGRIERGGAQPVVLVPTHPAGVIASVAYTETVFDRETSVDHRAAGRGLCPEADLSPSPIGWVGRAGSAPAITIPGVSCRLSPMGRASSTWSRPSPPNMGWI